MDNGIGADAWGKGGPVSGVGGVEIAVMVMSVIVLLLGLLGVVYLVTSAGKRPPDAPRGYRPYPRLRRPPGSRS